jgi:hypothetical protein
MRPAAGPVARRLKLVLLLVLVLVLDRLNYRR